MEVYKLNGRITEENNFFQGSDPFQLLEQYGSPLYVYNERILRERCREMKNLVKYPHYTPNYSAKANTNLAFLQIVRSEGFSVDAMSPGEIEMELLAGFTPSQILFIANNVSETEMKFALDKGIRISVDSLSQLETLGRLNPGGEAVIRFNPGVGAGHHVKVITGGDKTKFGVNLSYIPQVKEILKQYNLRLVGINQHIGSHFMDSAPYVDGAKNLFEAALAFEDLEFIDLGGGFGIPYRKQENQPPLDLAGLGARLDEAMEKFTAQYGKKVQLKLEPGRYISAECGMLLGTVYAIKNNGPHKYAGTDLGFNVLLRPAMYDSYHEVEVYSKNPGNGETEEITIVGNICESGDILADERHLPKLTEGDIIGVLDAGAYGHIMSSNYNCRLRTAEVFILADHSVVLTRERDRFDDIARKYVALEI